MNEHVKLFEARYFLEEMASSLGSPHAFQFNLSAFLSASRSVLQYALEDAKTRPGGNAWYDSWVIASAEIKYFKSKRDLNIHSEPVVPAPTLAVVEGLAVSSGLVGITITYADGRVEHGRIIEHEKSSAPQVDDPASPVSFTYRFLDWTGPEDIQTLCGTYLTALEGFVSEGKARGFVT